MITKIKKKIQFVSMHNRETSSLLFLMNHICMLKFVKLFCIWPYPVHSTVLQPTKKLIFKARGFKEWWYLWKYTISDPLGYKSTSFRKSIWNYLYWQYIWKDVTIWNVFIFKEKYIKLKKARCTLFLKSNSKFMHQNIYSSNNFNKLT